MRWLVMATLLGGLLVGGCDCGSGSGGDGGMDAGSGCELTGCGSGDECCPSDVTCHPAACLSCCRWG